MELAQQLQTITLVGNKKKHCLAAWAVYDKHQRPHSMTSVLYLIQKKKKKKETPRRLSKSSILYESSDPMEQTARSSDGDNLQGNRPTHHNEAQQHHGHHYQNDSTPSKTLVQGGQGGRRWSHELSPEKAGLVGSVLEVAALFKDVVLDTIQQHPPSASSSSTMAPPSSTSRPHLGLTPEEKLKAAKAAFGGSEETGDQTIYMDGLEEHLRHENTKRSTAEAAAASPATTTLEAKDLLGSAHEQEHRKSIFHSAASPTVRKRMLLDHPESLGYHPRDPALAPFEESALPTAQHRSARTHGTQEDMSKTTR